MKLTRPTHPVELTRPTGRRAARSLLLGASLSALTLAACGGDDDAASGSSATTAAPATSAASAATSAAAAADPYGGGSASATSAAPAAATNASLATAESTLGTILVDAEGMTVYLFTKDTGGSSVCNGDCAVAWPPVPATGDDTAGTGVDAAKLGSITRDDGTQQLTYAGKPLYYYAADNAPGDTKGQDVNDVWYVMDPAGNMISAR
jgi:predicted lipoprotein with Yx(FWY)xxD motif